MGVTSYNLKDVDKWAHDQAQRYQAAAKRGLLSAGLRLVQEIVTVTIPKTKPFPPVDRGAYRAGWRANSAGGGFKVVVRHVDEKMAAIVERGVRPENVKTGRAMIKALTGWVIRKGIGSILSVGKKTASVRNPNPEATAWAIASTMKKNGIPGKFVLERASSRAKEFLEANVKLEIERAIKRTSKSRR